MAVKNYIQFLCGEYPFLLSTEIITQIIRSNMDDLFLMCEQRDGKTFYTWEGQSIPLVNLNKRFGLDANQSAHQLILDGTQEQEDKRIIVVVGEVAGIIDADDEQFQPVQKLEGEFSRLVDATLQLKDKSWLRIRKEYFYFL